MHRILANLICIVLGFILETLWAWFHNPVVRLKQWWCGRKGHGDVADIAYTVGARGLWRCKKCEKVLG